MLRYLVEVTYREFLFDDPTEAMNFAITAKSRTNEKDVRVSINLVEDEDDDAQEN